MRRTLAAPGLAAVLGMALLLTACGKTNAHNNTAGETVSTALFDFSITDVSRHLSRVNAQKSKNIFYEARMRAISSRKSCSEHR